MSPRRHRVDAAAAVLLATLAFALYSYRATDAPATAVEKPLTAGIDLVTARVTMFVRVSADSWLPPVPAYGSVAMKVLATRHPARRAAAMFAAAGVGLLYIFALEVFHTSTLGWLSALLLLTNPAYLLAARTGSLDGVWVIPPLLVSLIGMAKFAECGSPRWLATSSAALAVCVYAQPSGALIAVIVATTAAIALARAGLLTIGVVARAAAAAGVVMLPLALLIAIHPSTYADTLGRWLLHPAYIRNPWSLLIRLTNWFSLAEWASIYWNFFDPTHLLYGERAPASAGTFLAAAGVFLIAAAYDLTQSQQPRTRVESVLLFIVALGFVTAPLVPASFSEPGAILKALSLTVFGTILCTIGVRAAWSHNSWWARTPIVALLGLALLQFVLFYLSVVSTGASYAGT